MAKHSETSTAAKVCVPTLLQSICQDLQLFPSMRGVGCRGGGGRGGNTYKQNFKQSFHNLYTCLCCSAFSHVHSVTCITCCCALVFSCLSVESVNEHCVFHLKSPPAGFESCRVMLHVLITTATETAFLVQTQVGRRT